MDCEKKGHIPVHLTDRSDRKPAQVCVFLRFDCQQL